MDEAGQGHSIVVQKLNSSISDTGGSSKPDH